MKASDITPFDLYTLGVQGYVKEGRHGVPVVALMVDKFTELTAPCGKVYQLYSGKKSKECLVAIRPEDAKNLWRLTNTSGWHRGIEIAPLGPTDEWIPLVVSNAQIRMTWDEYRLKADSRQELVDVLQIEQERTETAKRAYSASLQKLVHKASKRAMVVNLTPMSNGQSPLVTVPLDEFVRISTRPSPAATGVKKLLTQIDTDSAVFRTALDSLQRASTCVERAGIRNY